MGSPSVIVVGGGIAGLTVATLLNGAEADVTLLEASQSLGGLAKSDRTEGFPTEHSLRVYHEVYSCLFDLYKKIPFNENETLFDQLTPISLALIYEDDFYVYHPQKKKYVFTDLTEKIKLMLFLRRQGFTLRDFLHLLKEDLYDRACEERITHHISNLSMKEYLNKVSPAYLKIIFANYQMAFAGTKDTSALLAIQMDTEGQPFSFFAMANGPTSERIFHPWEKYLKSKGVKIKKGEKVTEFINENDKIIAAKLASGEVISGDIFVCSASDLEYIKLMKTKNKNLSDITFTEEWSNGFQFYLKALPKDRSALGELNQPGILRAHLHSPWKIVSVIQAKDFWKNVDFPEGCLGCLSMTVTDAHADGILHHKPLIECTQQEIREELLYQVGFNANELIIDWHSDEGLVFMDDEEYQKKKNTLASHQAHRRKDGKWILNFYTLYTPTPNDNKNELETRTDIKNLYLAGAICKTAMFIPTMEKACESGYLAAKAISEDFNLTKKINLPFKSYNTKIHSFWRTMDFTIFKIQCWVLNKLFKDKN